MGPVLIYLDIYPSLSIVKIPVTPHCISTLYSWLLLPITVKKSKCTRKIYLACLSLLNFYQFFSHSRVANISTSYARRNFYRVVSLGFPYYCTLSRFNCTSYRRVQTSFLSPISCLRVLSGIIRLWTKKFHFRF